jgi:hypothetical protein
MVVLSSSLQKSLLLLEGLSSISKYLVLLMGNAVV